MIPEQIANLSELVIVHEENGDAIASLIQDGEAHEENYGYHTDDALIELLKTLELETKTKATLVKVRR